MCLSTFKISDDFSLPGSLALESGMIAGCGTAGLVLGALAVGTVAGSILFGVAGSLFGVSWVATILLAKNHVISTDTAKVLLLLSGTILAASIVVAGIAFGLLSLPLIITFGVTAGILALACAAGLLYFSCTTSTKDYNETALGTLEVTRLGIKCSGGFGRGQNSSGGFPYIPNPFRFAVQKEKVDENIDYLRSLINIASQNGTRVDIDTETLANGDIVVTLKYELKS